MKFSEFNKIIDFANKIPEEDAFEDKYTSIQKVAYDLIKSHLFCCKAYNAYIDAKNELDWDAALEINRKLNKFKLYRDTEEMKSICDSLFKQCMEYFDEIDEYDENDSYRIRVETGYFQVSIDMYCSSVSIIYKQISSDGYLN